MSKETPFYFSNGSANLFGILHTPETTPSGCGFVFCNPIVEEKIWAHRVYVNFARQLASKGHSVLRFDYFGHGDSDGDYSNSTIDSMLDDTHSAVECLREKTQLESVSLFGLRMGGMLAAISAERLDRIDRLILWEPVVQGAKYMKELFRINITTQTAVFKEVRYNTASLVQQLKDGLKVNIDGYEILLPFYEQMITTDLCSSPKTFDREVLILQVNKRDGLGSKKADELASLYSKGCSSAVVEKTFWKEIREYYSSAPNLYNTTLEWLEQI